MKSKAIMQWAGVVIICAIFAGERACCQTLQNVASYGINIGTVAIDGEIGVINEGTAVRVMSLSPFSGVAFRGSVDIGAVPECLQVVGNYAYSAAESGKFSIIDLSNLDTPHVVGSADWDDWKPAVWVRKAADYAYVIGCSGIRVVDIRNKNNPVVSRVLPSNDCLYNITGDGGYLYIAHSTDAVLLSIYSLADPANPVLIGNGPPQTANAYHMHNGLTVFGDTAYASEYDQLAVIDISDRTTPLLRESLPAEGGQTTLDNSNGILHAGNWDHTRFFRLASPTTPDKMFDVFGIAGHEATQTAADGNLSYSARTQGLWITDISNHSVSLARSLTPNFGTAENLGLSGNTVFVGTGPGISALDISNPQNPVLLGQTASQWTGKFVIRGNILYNISAWGTIECFNISNPSSISKLSFSYPLNGTTFLNNRASIYGSTMVVAADKYLSLYTIAQDGSLTKRSEQPLTYGASASLLGSVLYVTQVDGSLNIYDVTNPANPVRSQTIQVFTGARPAASNTATQIVGNRLHLLFNRRGYPLYDITNPMNPALLGKYATDQIEAVSIAADENFAYLATFGWNGQKGVRVLDISNPSAIFEAVASDATNFVRDVILYNGYVYYAEERGCLRIRQALTDAAATKNWELY